ncbi:IS110 family transposase, partial [candidate division KSB1 bacterium]
MKIPKYTVGIDVSSEHFAATIMDSSYSVIALNDDFLNTPDGFAEFSDWISSHNVSDKNTITCMEATGVYGEELCYFLASQNFSVAVEQSLKIKRSQSDSGHKTDAIDSRNIAEYAHRYYDKLSFWKPNAKIVEQIKTLLTTREQLVKQCTAHKNALHALSRKHFKTPLAENTLTELIDDLKNHILIIDKEIKKLIDQDSSLKTMMTLLVTIPGVGYTLALHMLRITNGFSKQVTAKKLAAYAGICPYQCQSGTSLMKKPRSQRYGPSSLRKLLFLSALSLRTHNKQFNHYFYRKIEQGKPKLLVINNIANKLLKI